MSTTRRERSAAERAPVATIVWQAAEAVATGDTRSADVLIGLLEHDPPGTIDHELVALALVDALEQATSAAARSGWTPEDVSALRARRLKVPVGSSEIRRGVSLLGLLLRLPTLPPADAVRPSGTADDSEAPMLAKVRALLAKAESTTFAEEAEALTAKAQQLMARHRIDRAALETEGRRPPDRPGGRRIWLDDPYADAKAHLLSQVAKANRCRSVTIGDLGCCHVIGFAGDLVVVELLHTSLLVQATAAVAAAGSRTDGQGRSRTRSFRSSFLYAFGVRVGERLCEAVADAEAEGVAEHGAGVLPVLARRDEEVDEALAESFPDLVRRRAPRLTAEGWAAGRAAADTADLSVGQPVERAG